MMPMSTAHATHKDNATETGVRIEVIDSLQGMESIRALWCALLARFPQRNLFLTPSWNIAWWRTFGEGTALRLLTFHDHTGMVGIFPLCIYRSRMGGLPVRVLGTFSNAHSSRNDLVMLPGYEHRVVNALAQFLKDSCAQWDACHIQQIPQASAWLAHLHHACSTHGLLQTIPRPGVDKCILDITSDWRAYAAGRGAHFRKNINQTEKRLARAGQVEYVHTGCASPDLDFACFQDVERRSWKGNTLHDAHLGEQGWAFQQEFSTTPQEGITSDNWILQVDGKAIAIVHTVQYDRVNYCFQTLYDASTKDWYPGRAAVTRHFQHVFDSGRYDSLDLNGDSDFCKSWSSRTQHFVSLQLFHKRPFSAMLWTLKKAWART